MPSIVAVQDLVSQCHGTPLNSTIGKTQDELFRARQGHAVRH
jgi:hypothetical protein